MEGRSNENQTDELKLPEEKNQVSAQEVNFKGIVIREINFPPEQVLAEDLQTNGKIVSDEAIEIALRLAKKEEEDRLTNPNHPNKDKVIKILGPQVNKHISDDKDKSKFSFIYKDNQLYAVYSGKKDRFLGKGGEGKVKLVQNVLKKSVDDWSVIKVLGKQRNIEIADMDKYDKERAELREIGHDEVVKWRPTESTGSVLKAIELGFREAHYEHETIDFSYQIILPLVKGTDSSKFELSEGKLISPMERLNLAVTISNSFKNLIDNGILHCDIKLQNIMVDGTTGEAGPVDFSFSLTMNDDRVGHAETRGTPRYLAPEILERERMMNQRCEKEIKELARLERRNKNNMFDTQINDLEEVISKKKGENTYNEKTEVFALGVALIHFFGCHVDRGVFDDENIYFPKDDSNHPYEIKDYNPHEELKDIVQLTTKFSQLIPDPEVRKQLLAVLQTTIAKDPSARPTMSALNESLQKIATQQYLELPAHARIKNVGMVSVDELKQKIKDGMIDKDFIATMKKFNQIILVGGPNTISSVVHLQKELAENGINVNPKLYLSDVNTNHELVTRMPEYLDQTQPKQLNNYFYITDLKNKSNLKIESDNPRVKVISSKDNVEEKIHEHLSNHKVTQVDFNKVKASLEEQITVLQRKIQAADKSKKGIYQTRSNAIQQWIDEWTPGKDGTPKGANVKGQDTYLNLIKSLDDLANQMTHTSKITKTASGWLSKLNVNALNSKGSAAITKIKESITESISIKPPGKH